MRYLIIGMALIAMGCSTTPNTDQQWDKHYARQDAAEHKAWCLANDGVYVVDAERGNKCYRDADFNAAIHRARL